MAFSLMYQMALPWSQIPATVPILGKFNVVNFFHQRKITKPTKSETNHVHGYRTLPTPAMTIEKHNSSSFKHKTCTPEDGTLARNM
jgi:hypothetical protein